MTFTVGNTPSPMLLQLLQKHGDTQTPLDTGKSLQAELPLCCIPIQEIPITLDTCAIGRSNLVYRLP